MQIELIGVVAFLIGLISLGRSPGFSVYMVFLSTLLGASAAAILTALGGASLQPAHLMLAFVLLKVGTNPYRLADGLSSLSFPRPGFWLLITVLYALAGAVLITRLFAGSTNVYSIARLGDGVRIALVPLVPTTGNVTQSLYFASDLLAYVAFYACSKELGSRSLAVLCSAAVVCAFANFAFGLIDVATYLTGTGELLSFLRNAGYTMLVEVEMAGFKRVVGSFSEASTYGSASLFLFTFTGKMWLEEVYTRRAGLAAAVSLIAVIASTSTTAYAGLAIVATIEYLTCLYSLVINRRSTRNATLFLFLGPFVVAFIVMAGALQESVWNAVQSIYQAAFSEKLTSDSGVERSSWNYQGLQNLFETNGLGVGVGSTRTSSWPLAVLASLGVIGTVTYFAFVLLFLLARPVGDARTQSFQKSIRLACVTQVVLGSIGSPFVDLGLLFFMCAGVSMAVTESERSASVARAQLLERGGVPAE
ncbi:hypothetical protein [Methylobacterium sp. SI9]|uniref:hypothetical protein n=1 Tax=Methylobacterium guangdongense TaxID=3138811 RepID=UPI00313DAAA2